MFGIFSSCAVRVGRVKSELLGGVAVGCIVGLARLEFGANSSVRVLAAIICKDSSELFIQGLKCWGE